MGLSRADRIFGRPLVGDVGNDLREPAQFAGLIDQCGNRDSGEKLTAVLAETPVLLLEASLGPGPSEIRLRLSGCTGIGRIEQRRMFPEDFGFAPPLEAFGARVPDRHMAGRVEHVDRMPLRPIDQEVKLLDHLLRFTGVSICFRIARRRPASRAIDQLSKQDNPCCHEQERRGFDDVSGIEALITGEIPTEAQ